jgi:hypothetical protein
MIVHLRFRSWIETLMHDPLVPMLHH